MPAAHWGGATFVNGEGENVIGIHAGANAALSPALVDARNVNVSRRRMRVTDAAGIAAESAAPAAPNAHHHRYCCALTRRLPAATIPDELLALVDIITPNETEAEKLTCGK